jgi:hypothetical protein
LQQELREAFNKALERELDHLAAHEVWKKLSSSEATKLLEAHALVPCAPLSLGTEADVVAAVTQNSVALWRARTSALSGTVASVLSEAILLKAPAAVRVQLPGAQLHTASDVDQYLAGVRSELMQHIAAGKPIVI